jgi:hypothetical protein
MEVCDGCKKERTSIKPSRLTGKPLCGLCRIEEYEDLRGEAQADAFVSQYWVGC